MTADEEFDFSSLAGYRANADFIEATAAAALVVFVSTGNWTQMPINPHSHSVKLNDGDSLKRFAQMQNFAELRNLRWQSFTTSDGGNSPAQVSGGVSEAAISGGSFSGDAISGDAISGGATAAADASKSTIAISGGATAAADAGKSKIAISVATGVRNLSLISSAPFFHLRVTLKDDDDDDDDDVLRVEEELEEERKAILNFFSQISDHH